MFPPLARDGSQAACGRRDRIAGSSSVRGYVEHYGRCGLRTTRFLLVDFDSNGNIRTSESNTIAADEAGF